MKVNKLDSHSFMEAGKRHEIPASEIKANLFLMAIADIGVSRVSGFASHS